MKIKKKDLVRGDLSTRRRKRKSFKIWFKLFFALLVIVGAVFLLRVQAFQIKDIKTSGLKSVSEEQLKGLVEKELAGSYFALFPKTNALFYPKASIQGVLRETYPKFSTLNIKSSIIDHTLYIETEEKVPAALWCSSECYFLDKMGTVFSAVGSSPTEGLIRYEGLIEGNPMNKTYSIDFGSYAELLSNLQTLGFSVEKVKIIDADSGEVDLGNFSIKFLPKDTKTSDLFENIKIFIDNLKSKNGGALPPLQYIDARYGNKIFYK